MQIPLVPPLLSANQANDPFPDAIGLVRRRKAGAGDLFWFHDKARVQLAVVLEPDVSMVRALEMAPLTMVALCDCIGAVAPPQVGVQFRTPMIVTVNGGIVGSIDAAVSHSVTDNEVPDWLIIGLGVALKYGPDEQEPGMRPELTTLEEEGCGDLDGIRFIETFARHFLSWIATWNDEGFASIARSWKFRAEDQSEPDLNLIRNVIRVYESKV